MSTFPRDRWWDDVVVYQIYPRSFQDTDGDGVGDLRGITARLDHVVSLGAEAIWLSPIYPSPMADFGYDVTDFTAVDPIFGTLADLDALLAAAHRRDLRVLLDLVPCHTSIEHPWFREHPDWYIRVGGDAPPNNWQTAFGGSAWSPDPVHGGWYLHSFYPEQADLDWRNPAVVVAMQEVIRFWLDRGVDGFRLDAIDRLVKDAALRDDPPATDAPRLPEPFETGLLPLNSRNSPDIRAALQALRHAAGDRLLVGEVYVPSAELAPYLEHVDVAFCFELFHAAWHRTTIADAIRSALDLAAGEGGVAWVLSNHDFPRLATRVGLANVRAAAVMLLTLPGMVFVFQGDEIGMPDGPGHDPPFDRAGRDVHRHPMAWDGDGTGGFTSGTPWLALVDAATCNVAAQARRRESLLWLYRDAIALRRELRGPLVFMTADGDLLAYRRGDHVIVVNFGDHEQALPVAGEIVLVSDRSPASVAGHSVGPHAAAVIRAPELSPRALRG